MTHSSKKILILADNRPGTYSQAISLAKELNEEFEILNISYSWLIKLPNFFFPHSLFRYDKQTKKKLKSITKFPQIIISPGRRSVSAALYLKNKSLNDSKIVQIMDPNLTPDKFDLVVLPTHDEHIKHPKIINSIGALTSIDLDQVYKDKEKFSDFFDKIDKKIVVLLVGGPSKNASFSEDSAAELAKISSAIVNDLNAKLMILTSPRTSLQMMSGIKKGLDCDFHIFDYEKEKRNNPYHACLGYGEYFIVSGDSVSMISECCSLGKAVMIFDNGEISSKKHKSFHQCLYIDNYATKLSESINIDNVIRDKTLNEAERIALIVKEKFLF